MQKIHKKQNIKNVSKYGIQHHTYSTHLTCFTLMPGQRLSLLAAFRQA